jgi:hypothetical protein
MYTSLAYRERKVWLLQGVMFIETMLLILVTPSFVTLSTVPTFQDPRAFSRTNPAKADKAQQFRDLRIHMEA